MDVSIIIVNYNTSDLTLQCLSSIYERTKGLSFEIIVVDNASSDNSVISIKKNFPEIKLIESLENLGFGNANNLGAKYASGKYLFLLNSDTILLDNTIKQFYNFMENNLSIAACGASLVDLSGQLKICHGKFPTLFQEFSDIGFKKFYPNYYRKKLSLGQTAIDGTPNNVGYISGADVFIRRSVFELLSGFDKDYFMYYEETDMFYRMYRKGLHSCILSQYSIVHIEGGSFQEKSRVNIKRLKMLLTSKFLFFKKNYSWLSYHSVKFFSILNILLHHRFYKGHIWELLRFISINRYNICKE